jgi:hypothetical protein
VSVHGGNHTSELHGITPPRNVFGASDQWLLRAD